MPVSKYTTPEAILRRAQEAIGIPFKEIDRTGRLEAGKGAVGTVLEESWFDLKVNSESEPDFGAAKVELKATPYIRNSKGIRAKERLVCNIINYMEEYQKEFFASSFYQKCNTMLIMSYEHKKEVSKGEFFIEKAILYRFPKDDLAIIQKDWEHIMGKVRAGKAHEISEGDTLYLGACTKGASRKSVRQQPCSDIMAMQRAYALKTSYMTYLLNRFIFGSEEDEHIIKNPDSLKSQSFENYLIDQFLPYIGKSQAELKQELGIGSSPKSLNYLLASAILKVGDIHHVAEFKKANIKVKTITLEADGRRIRESMSFPAFSFKEIIHQSFEASPEYEYFVEQKYLFLVFKKDEDYKDRQSDFEYGQKHLFLTGAFLWQLPENDIEEVRLVFERLAATVKKGVCLVMDGGRVKNDLPKSKESPVAHVRPHASRAAYRFEGVEMGDLKDADELPDGRWMTKQCFWFNNSYILRQIHQHIGEQVL